jgi:SAM-dependent methyltransferase
MEIDIAVDLAGYTSDSRADIFAHRPVPVQVNYLGYPGTMGTGYMDYILADRHVIPENQQQFYNEKVVYLPDTYLPTDSGIQIAERTPSREECGLPATGVVFCSFSHDYKILPATFAVWMRLLQQVPGSVLWLMSRRDISIHNLCLAAEQHGIDPARLVFATRVPLVEDHLARYRLADIFLDTHPYNAHTTAADALMAGLPVVTYMGNAFPSRVAGSLLQAIGMPELIAQSLEEYEQIALKLVTTPELLADVKARLIANKTTCALFDTEKFTRNLEEAYMTMHGQDEFGDAGYQTQLDGIKQFQELSYETQTAHWLNDGITPDRLLIHQSWFREDTIDFWRHERMNEAVFKCLIHTQSDRWLTVGDGRYGLDAIRMVRRGFSDVTATDLTDHLLKISFDAGLLKKISAENAEKLSFSDSSFDFVLCKEAFHHFPRPMLALYEMLRVACKGVVFIEPLDQYIDIPILGGKHSAGYEADGNYVYTLSRREVEKAALGLNLPAVAFKNICDTFDPGLTSELALESNPDFISFRNKLIDIEARCEKMELQYNVLMAVIFITMPNESEIKFFTELGWSFEKLDRNPFVKQE